MELAFSRFRREYYQEYAAWFSDPELNRQLGPLDEDWLSAVLSEQAAETGDTWVVFLSMEMVGVVSTVFDPENRFRAGITEIAVKPTRRRQGLAKAILKKLLSDHHDQGIISHVTYIKATNEVSRHLFEGLGFMAQSEPDRNGFIEYRHSPSQLR